MATDTQAGPSTSPQPSSRVYGSISDTSSPADSSEFSQWTLKTEARRLIDSFKHHRHASASLAPSSAELSVHLCAVQLLYTGGSALTTPDLENIRARVAERYERDRLAADLLRAVEAILDDQVSREEDDDELVEMLWRPWPVDEKRSTCAVELLLRPYTFPGSARLIAHPLISASLDSIWHSGLPPHPSAKRVKFRFLRRAITPRRLHAFHLVSFWILYGLVLYLSLHPGKLFTPYVQGEDGSKENKAGIIEGLAVLWIAWDIWPTVYHRYNPTRILLMSPLYLALISTRPSPQIAFTLLTLSIPCLTTLLVLPHYPSIPLLSAQSSSAGCPTSLLSLSCVLAETLRRLIRPFLLIIPLLLALVAVFSCAMNGDLSRGFVIPTSATSVGVPVEEGIAPYQTRAALFTSIALLLFYALVTGTATSSTGLSAGGLTGRGRAAQAAEELESDTARASRRTFAQAVLLGLGGAKSPVELSDAWKASDQMRKGTAGRAGEESRLLPPPTARHIADGSNRALGPAQCAVPLDQLLAPFDLVKGLVRLAGVFGWKGSAAWHVRIGRVMEGAVVVIMGPLCALLIPVEWISDWIRRQTRPR